jgi:hypothetical protein
MINIIFLLIYSSLSLTYFELPIWLLISKNKLKMQEVDVTQSYKYPLMYINLIAKEWTQIPPPICISDTSHLHGFHYLHQLSLVFSLPSLHPWLVIGVSGGAVCNAGSMGEQAAY